MRLVWVFVAGSAGLVIGAISGFLLALVAMSLGPARSDGTYGMREVMICLPAGAFLGALAGLAWGLTRP